MAASSSKDMTFPSDMEDGNFKPSDEELVAYYLHNKVHGFPNCQDAIKDFDLYGDQEPWQVFQRFGGVDGQDLYFFTPLKKKRFKNQDRYQINRQVGNNGGTWSQENGKTPIVSSENGKLLGFCKQYQYKNPGSEHHGMWMMYEYSLLDQTFLIEKDDIEFVLCRIRKKYSKKDKAPKKQ